MLILLRQSKISKWFSGIGQEAVSVGCAMALNKNDYILPLHRSLGVFTSRNIPFKKLFAQWQGKKSGFTKGRDRSFHFGTEEYRIIGMISHLGAMLGVADGLSLGSNLEKENFISLVFSGDGGASEGDFHEAINVAAVWDLPVIFLIENNGYGLSTPSSEQFRCKQFIDKAIGYGIEGVQVDGNNILEVHKTVANIAERMRQNRKPVILEAMTFRMRGHEEASGTKYVPKELMEQWAIKDPVLNYEKYLVEIDVLNEGLKEQIRSHFKKEMEHNLEEVFAQPEIIPDTNEELSDVYAPSPKTLTPPVIPASPNVIASEAKQSPEKRLIDAIKEGLFQAMEKDKNLILMGQDIAEYGGAFKLTEGFIQQFGKDRVRNTPLCESAILGCGLGLSLRGFRSMIEMQFADFVSCGFNQIVNNLAKTYYRWGHKVKVVVRLPTGAGVAAGPFHSQSDEEWFCKIPGLKVVYPATPFDAKGLLTTAFLEENPVLFFEHKALYRSVSGNVPIDYYNLPIGVGNRVNSGNDISIITYGAGVHWALDLQKEKPNISMDIIDLRTLLPWDKELVFESVKKTGKCLILHEDTISFGIGAEVAACVSEQCFSNLDAPIIRVGSLDTPVPFHAELERNFLPINRFKEKLEWLAKY